MRVVILCLSLLMDGSRSIIHTEIWEISLNLFSKLNIHTANFDWIKYQPIMSLKLLLKTESKSLPQNAWQQRKTEIQHHRLLWISRLDRDLQTLAISAKFSYFSSHQQLAGILCQSRVPQPKLNLYRGKCHQKVQATKLAVATCEIALVIGHIPYDVTSLTQRCQGRPLRLLPNENI